MATIIRAEGESESAALITQAMEQYGDAYLSVRRIDTAKEIADALCRSRNVTYLPREAICCLGFLRKG